MLDLIEQMTVPIIIETSFIDSFALGIFLEKRKVVQRSFKSVPVLTVLQGLPGQEDKRKRRQKRGNNNTKAILPISKEP